MYTSETFWLSDTIITMYIGPDEQYFKNKVALIFLAISLDICLSAQKNRLAKTVLLSTHNIFFGLEIRKFMYNYAFLSGGV